MSEEKFDMAKKTIKPVYYLVPVEWLASLIFKFQGIRKIRKTNFKSFREPSIIISNHSCMFDFPSILLAMFPYRTTWCCSIEEFQGVEWLYRHIGLFPKRKFTTDLSMVKNIYNLINKRHISVTLFPEARYCIGGINEDIGTGLGKLAKFCKCRVIFVKQMGNYLKSPQWGKHPYRKNYMEVTCTELFSKEDAVNKSVAELDKIIADAFQYDHFKWQIEKNLKINCKERATGIHRILYKCPICNKEGTMDSKGTKLWCNSCHSEWEMDELSKLHCTNNKETYEIVSDWYKWERKEAYKEVEEGTYHFEDDVRVEKFVNSKEAFRDIGTVHMIHDENGYEFKGTLDDGTLFDLKKPPLSTRSMHIEFNYKGRGDALDIATLEDTWFVFPKNPCCLAKFNFTTEAIFEKVAKEKK